MKDYLLGRSPTLIKLAFFLPSTIQGLRFFYFYKKGSQFYQDWGPFSFRSYVKIKLVKKICAYCGKPAVEKEHVFPKCLYPASKSVSKVQRLTVPACSECNHGWEDDEAHFRNILVLAGEDITPIRRELWDHKVSRSFREGDGQKRILDIVEAMKPVIVDGRQRSAIYPGNDQRVTRVIKKVIRGLCYHHGIITQLSEKRIWVDVLKYQIPQHFLSQMQYSHREQDIVEYRWDVLDYDEINSAWIITFFNTIPFVGLVSTSENGFS